MPTTLSGVQGNATLSIGTFKINRWRARLGPDLLDQTGFGSTLKQRMAGMGDLTGTLSGYLTTDANPAGLQTGTVGGTALNSYTAVVSLMGGPSTGLTATVILSDINIDVNQLNTTTASTLSANFSNAATTYLSNFPGI